MDPVKLLNLGLGNEGVVVRDLGPCFYRSLSHPLSLRLGGKRWVVEKNDSHLVDSGQDPEIFIVDDPLKRFRVGEHVVKGWLCGAWSEDGDVSKKEAKGR